MDDEAAIERKITAIESLQHLQKVIEHTQDRLLRTIVSAREDGGLTFQEIAESLGRSSKGSIHTLYMQAKEQGY